VPTIAADPALPHADARFWDRSARAYARSPIADPVGYERTIARVAELLRPTDAAIELGCGTGTTALRLAPLVRDYVATDLSSEMVAIAREKSVDAPIGSLRFDVGTADTAFAPEGGYDVVLAFNLLHLVGDLPATLARVRAMLRPGGLFFSKTACVAELNPLIRLALPVMRLVGKAPATVGVFGEPALRGAIEAAGFEIEAVERHGAKGRDVRVFVVARTPGEGGLR
jgi:SAM-dependent methyltransferase